MAHVSKLLIGGVLAVMVTAAMPTEAQACPDGYVTCGKFCCPK